MVLDEGIVSGIFGAALTVVIIRKIRILAALVAPAS
jgi:hypothetical protein